MDGTDNGFAFDDVAIGFTFNEGIARNPNQDTAYFEATPGTTLVSQATTTYLERPNAAGTAIVDEEVAVGFTHVRQ